MLPTPVNVKDPKIQRTSIMEWIKGYNSVSDDDRKSNDSLKLASNVWEQQNGTVRPRPSLARYGTQPPGTVLGSVFPFVDSTGGTPVNKEIAVINVAGTAKAYVRQDGGSWTVTTGKTYNTSAKCRFEQVNNVVLVMNGVDNLSYLTCGTTTITPFTSLSTPTITSVTPGSGLTTAPSLTYYYRISACNQGETAACAATTISVNKLRDQWKGSASNEMATIVFPRVTGASRYNVYVGDVSGFEYYLDTVADPGAGTAITYVDDNSLALNTNRIAPNGDSTAGPRVTRATNVLGQLFMVGDADNPYRVWFGGFGNAALDFSAFDGGGWVEIDKGGRNLPVKIHGFRDGHGNPAATCLMQGTSGRGKIVHISMSSTTIGNTILTFASIAEGNGQDGTVSPDGVIYAQDSLFYPSKDAFKRTGSNPDLLNILSTTSISQQIIPDVQGLNIQNMAAAVGIERQGYLFWAVPVGSTTNNQVWVCDLNRGGLWTLPWYISIDWMWLYDDSNGATHHMCLSNGVIYELTYNQLTTDDATAFFTDIKSGLVKFAPDGIEWVNVIDVTFVFERPIGTVNLAVTGKTQDNTSLSSLGSGAFSSTNNPVGWSEFAWDDAYHNYDKIVTVPLIAGQEREEVTIEVDEIMPYLAYEVSSNSPNVDFQLADVIVRWVDVGVVGLSDS